MKSKSKTKRVIKNFILHILLLGVSLVVVYATVGGSLKIKTDIANAVMTIKSIYVTDDGTDGGQQKLIINGAESTVELLVNGEITVGSGHIIVGERSSILGGEGNVIIGDDSTIGGGTRNKALCNGCVIGGGSGNLIGGGSK